MVRTPKSLDEAKEIIREERTKITTSVSAIAGSRWLMAILAALVLTFGSHLIFAPERLPAIEWLHWQNIGLPPSFDFGFAGEQAREAAAAAVNNGARERAEAALAENQDRYALINMIAFGLTFVLLIGNMWIMTKRRPYTRG